MGEFKASSTADGSWAHPPGEDVDKPQMLAGPFAVQEMPARPPAPAPRSPQSDHLLRTVAPADGDDE